MPVKCSWLFNGTSGNRDGKVWGFSENWYSGLSGNALVAAMDTVSSFRRLLLASDTVICGYRIGVDGGRSYVVRRTFAAPRANDASNIPVDSALCQCSVNGSTTIKKFWFHDLPDDWVNSTLILDARRQTILNCIGALVNNGFMVRYQVPNAIGGDVQGITALGEVTTVQATGLAAGNLVQFLNCKDINGRTVRGKYIIASLGAGNTFTLAHWSGQVVARRGRVRLVQFAYGAAQTFAPDSTLGLISGGSRKVGRPFFQSRGRVPVRR